MQYHFRSCSAAKVLAATRPLSVLALAVLAGCAGLAEKNYRYTGEVRMYQANTGHEQITGEGLYQLHDAPGAKKTFAAPGADSFFNTRAADGQPEQTIAISLNRAFLKYLAEIGKPEVLAYVEVQEGEQEPTRKIFFRDDYQPSGALLNFQDALIYGPKPYSGQPLRIRFFVYELDSEDNQVAAGMLSALAGVSKTLATPYGVAAKTATDILGDVMNSVIKTNVDDREFYHEVTLYPVAPGSSTALDSVATLRTGTFVVVKKELQRNVAVESLVDFEDERRFPLPAKDGAGNVTGYKNDSPSVICRSGELYQHRSMEGALYEQLRLALQSKAEKVGKEIDKERQSAASGRRFRGSSPKADKILRDLVLQVKNETGALITEKTTHDSGSGGIVAPANSALARWALAAGATAPIENYEPYRAKSYLTFSVLNHLPAADAEVLNAVYTKHAKEIEDTLNADLDVKGLTDGILKIQDKLSQAIIARAAENMLRKTPPDKQEEALAQLKNVYGEERAGLIDEVKKQADARAALATLTAPKKDTAEATLQDLFGTEVGAWLAGTTENDRKNFLEQLSKIRPDAVPAVQQAFAILDLYKTMTKNAN